MKTKTNKKETKGLLIRPVECQSETATQTAPAGPCGTHPAPAPVLSSPPPTADAPAPASAAPSRPPRPYVNYEQRAQNRALPTERVLDLLRRWMPRQYELAEVVGQWVWVTFTEQPEDQVRAQLSQFGFHWNNTRKCWQHPCGHFATEGSGQDPRQKYGTQFAADLKAA